jgi:uncharacterized membrane protein
MQVLIDALLLGLIAAAIDVPWLIYNQTTSSKLIQGIQGSAPSVRIGPAAAVYVAIGILLTRARSPLEAALIGSATYAVYDFTNYATLKAYDLSFALTDIVWGGVLFGLTAIIAERIGAFRFRD